MSAVRLAFALGTAGMFFACAGFTGPDAPSVGRPIASAQLEGRVVPASQPCADDVASGFGALVAARSRVQLLREAFDDARKHYFVALRKYSVGVAEIQPVFDAERSLLVLEESLQASEAEEMQTLARLFLAMAADSCGQSGASTSPPPARVSV